MICRNSLLAISNAGSRRNTLNHIFPVSSWHQLPDSYIRWFTGVKQSGFTSERTKGRIVCRRK